VTTLQVNLGKLCNQACHHCHVEAGPGRKEIMAAATAERVLELLAGSPQVLEVDITGGAPELNPSFRRLVHRSRDLGRAVMVRSNLTVLLEDSQQDTISFLANHAVKVVASLPCYTAANVDRQRGDGVFDASVRALRALNAMGYGMPGTDLELDLVYNPLGPSLPPPQAQLEADYRRQLDDEFGIRFSRLLTITNMPIKRFADDLDRHGRTDDYMDLLVKGFRRENVDGLMCRDLVSVAWTGELHDCDFNQMLDLPLGVDAQSPPRTIWDIDSLEALTDLHIRTAPHCFGCTAGAGSSCTGALTAETTV
jgi:radical SAM/Cys-rich protein